MENKNYLTKSEVLEKTGIKFYRLDYLVKAGRVPVIRRGSGRKRLFPPKAVEKIKEIEGIE